MQVRPVPHFNFLVPENRMQHEDEDIVTDNEDSDCPCIHWTAATIIQKKFKVCLYFINNLYQLQTSYHIIKSYLTQGSEVH